MRTWQFRPWTVPLALLVFCVISFGLLIPWLGFYWDDWPSIYYLHVLGPKGFIDAFAGDRPTLGWLFMVTSTLIGESTVAWQAFGLFTRWSCSLAFWWALRSLWPENTRQVTWATLLFAAYPGFLQQYIAVTYSHTWLVLAAYFVSIATMIEAIRKPKYFWPFMALSGALSAFCMFTDEYFFGLELLRPVFLWLALPSKPLVISQGFRRVRTIPESNSQRLLRVILRWLPFMAIMAVFLVWRLILHVSPRGQVQIFDKLRDSPIAATQELVVSVVKDIANSSLLAWGQVFNIPMQISSGAGLTAVYAAVVILVVLLALFYLSHFKAQESDSLEPDRRWSFQAMLIGLMGLLVGGIPFWVTNLPIDLRFPWDRFTLAMNLGASLFFAGLLELLIRNRLANMLVLTVALGLAAGMHLQIANIYRREWNAQKAFFWQLVWRAPGIQPGTMILSAELPFTYYSDNSLTTPLNWTYAPQQTSRQLPYLFYNIESRLGGKLAGFHKGQSIYEPYRAMSFTGSTSQTLAIYYSPPGCVKVVDPTTDARTPQKPLYFSQVLPLSNLGLIQAEANPSATPPKAYFGDQPKPDWCYYFEKADLARHQGNWQEVVRLGAQALELNIRLYEVNAPELLPYIEGNARTGNWALAKVLTQQAQRLNPRMQRILCDTWNRINQEVDLNDEARSTIFQTRYSLNCSS